MGPAAWFAEPAPHPPGHHQSLWCDEGGPARPRGSGPAPGNLLAGLSSTSRSWRVGQVAAPVETEACSPRLCLQVVAWVPRGDRPGAGSSSEGGFPPWQCLRLSRRPRAPQRAGPGSGSHGGGGQGSGSSPDEAPGVRSVPVPLPLAGCSRGAFPGHLSLRLCPRQGPLCWLTLLRSSPPVGPHPGCGHSAGTGGRTRLFGLLPEGKEALPGRSKLPVAGGVQAGH